RAGNTLWSFWRDGGPPYAWHGPSSIIGGATGNPVLIQSRFGSRGNFELVTPLSAGGGAHVWRNNDDPALPWVNDASFGQCLGNVEAITMIQSNFGAPGNLEVVARVGTGLWAFYRDSSPPFTWHASGTLPASASGMPTMVQSRFGSRGNFELVTPL